MRAYRWMVTEWRSLCAAEKAHRTLSVAVAVTAVAALTGVGVWMHRPLGSNLDSPEGRARLRAVAEGRSIGSAAAPVVLVEYASLDCASCARFESDVFPMILAKYITTGRVRFVLRVIAAGPLSLRGAATALCVRRQYYFAFVDLLLRTQSSWDKPELAEAGLTQAAYAAGLTDKHADACRKDPLTMAALQRASKDSEPQYEAAALPMFVIDGREYIGKADGLSLHHAIDAAEASHLRK